MEKELLLLRELHLNPKITQRQMAKALGLSLGSVNELIKRMNKNGIVRIEKVSQRRKMYRLTPLGISQKAEGTYKYILEAYTFLVNLNKRIDNLLSSINNDNTVVLFGEKDDLCEAIKMKLKKKKTRYIVSNSYEEIRELSEKNKLMLIVWHPEKITLVNDSDYSCIDLLSSI